MSEESKAPEPSIFLVVGTPCYGGLVSDRYLISMLELQRACASWGVKMHCQTVGGDALITRARNTLAAIFLDHPQATHLMFIDADIGFDPIQVARMLAFDKPVVGGAYPLKHIDWDNIKARVQDGSTPLEAASLRYVVGLSGNLEETPEENGFVSADYAGTGFLLIKRHVFEQLALLHPDLAYESALVGSNRAPTGGQHYAFFDCMIDPATRTYLPEDYAFCKRWTDAGGEIWVDMRSKLTHVGAYAFQGDLGAVLDAKAQKKT